MRITKKFAGSNGIGKQIFSPTIETEKTLVMRKTLEREIEELEKRFFKKIDSSLAQHALISPRKSIATMPSDLGYRVMMPSERADSITNYASFLRFIDDRKTKASTTSTTIIPAVKALDNSPDILTPLQFQNIAPVSKSLVSDKRPITMTIAQPTLNFKAAYVDTAYRVHGFEAFKADAAKWSPPPSKAAYVSAPAPTQLEKVNKVDIKTRYLVTKTEEPPVASSIKNESMGIDPSIDLHASTLLLDFFRAARDKEYAVDKTSIGKRDRVYVDHRYHVVDSDIQDLKRTKTAINGGFA